MLRRSLGYLSRNGWLKEHLPRYRFAQRAVQRFMPGERLQDALTASHTFHSSGMCNILTYLGEDVENPEEARAMAREYVDALDEVKKAGLDCQVSVKLTQLGLHVDGEEAHRNVTQIIRRAVQGDNFVWIDMESSADTDVTLDEFRRLRQEHPSVGVCLQAYLYRTPNDLDGLLPLRPAIRLVKGAYAEPREIAYPRRDDVDESYFQLARTLLEQRKEDGETWPAFATHDRALIERIQAVAEEIGVPRHAYEFQMLYGIERKLQEELAGEGFRVNVLISYGEAWFAWFMRRLAERPANVGFMLKHAFRG